MWEVAWKWRNRTIAKTAIGVVETSGRVMIGGKATIAGKPAGRMMTGVRQIVVRATAATDSRQDGQPAK